MKCLSHNFPSVPSALSRLCFIPWQRPASQEASGVRAHLLLQLQDCRVGLLEVLLQLQSQVVDSNAGDRGHAALRRLCRARGGGAEQNKPHHDDGERQDVEPGELGGERKSCGLAPSHTHLCNCLWPKPSYACILVNAWFLTSPPGTSANRLLVSLGNGVFFAFFCDNLVLPHLATSRT